MTTEERFERIEHVTAGLAEERRKDREENRQLWRETQRQLNELTIKVADTNDAIARLADEVRNNAEAARVADQELRERISSLVSAIGEMIRAPRQS
jgi:hypothetical protein